MSHHLLCAPAPSRTYACADDRALLHAIRMGDAAAWYQVVDRYGRLLRHIARSFRLQPADVEEVLQQTWLALVKDCDAVRSPEALGGWLATTAQRRALRLLQRHGREQLTDDVHAGDDLPEEGAEARVIQQERHAALHRAVRRLPERHRRILMALAVDPPLPYEQIGALLDVPVGSIGPTRARCIERLARDPELCALREA